jgi:hypothetical protein
VASKVLGRAAGGLDLLSFGRGSHGQTVAEHPRGRLLAPPPGRRSVTSKTTEDGGFGDFRAAAGTYLTQRRHAGEMHVNIGGNPDRDDYDLPAVDIEIPDDARELDRDVQAYRRELRARRRRRLARRLRGPLTRGGMVLPLLASCLALTLLAGATLTMFSAGRGLQEPAQPTALATAGRLTPAPAHVSAVLPATTAQVDGRPKQLRALAPAVLALIPSVCRCVTALRQLSAEAGTARVPVYLVGARGWMPEVDALAAQTSAALTSRGSTHVVDDAADVLGSVYHRAGLTVVLVYANGSVSAVRRDLEPGVQLTSSLQALGTSRPPSMVSSPGVTSSPRAA